MAADLQDETGKRTPRVANYGIELASGFREIGQLREKWADSLAGTRFISRIGIGSRRPEGAGGADLRSNIPFNFFLIGRMNHRILVSQWTCALGTAFGRPA